jgi:hypothetical protein
MVGAPRRLILALIALALAPIAACSTAADRPTDWDYVHTAILRPSCATSACHSRLGSQAGIDLSTPDAAYVFLTGRVCGAPELPGEPVGNFVRPGHPESSELMYLLRGESITIMPPDVPLPDVEIAIIERWILEGATCD